LKEGLARCGDGKPVCAELLIPERRVCDALENTALSFNHRAGSNIVGSRVEQHAINTKTTCFQNGYPKSKVPVATPTSRWRNVVADVAAIFTEKRSIDSVPEAGDADDLIGISQKPTVSAWYPAGFEISTVLFVNKAADVVGKATSRRSVEIGIVWIIPFKVIEHCQEGLLVLL